MAIRSATPARWLPRAITNAWHILRGYDTEPVELLFGLLTLAWGIWLMLPFTSFGTGGGFALLAGRAPEVVWGLIFAVQGASQLIALLVTTGAHGRRQAAMRACCLWAVVAVSLVVGNPTSTGTVVYTLIAAGHGWLRIRLRDSRLAQLGTPADPPRAT